MPYVLWKKNGKRVNHPFVYTQAEAERIANAEKGTTFLNTSTRRLTKLK